MKALRSFTVRPRLPESLRALEDLAMNLRWAWDERTRDLFRWVDPDAWEDSRHDPVRLLGLVSRARLVELEEDPAFRTFLDELSEASNRYLERPRWFQSREGLEGGGESPLRSIAYFSPEFGIAEALPQYSGGLGVLAGDHLKAASDLGVPLVGVGLFYRHGYFRQSLSADGWQQERYPELDPYAMALRATDAIVTVDLRGASLHARVWRADVGRVRLYLLDADVEENEPPLREITDRLYGGDTEHRLRQEILLGVGGVRALEAVGEDAQVFHTNEGHAGFLGFERIRRLVVDQGLSFAEALEAARGASIFTTHTPVPAGIDRFPRPLIETYFGGWANAVGLTFDEVMELGHEPGEAPDAPFNMAVMGLRLAGRSNAVSKLHGAVSRAMFAPLWPGAPEDEVPITSVTNGVHGHTWVSSEMSDLLSRHVQPEWPEAPDDRWARIEEAGDDEVWRVRDQSRQRLVTFVRSHLKSSLAARGVAAGDAGWTDDVLDPSALTICFARRFATYKRATLLLSQVERLQNLLLSRDRPVQFVFAGKAHPADDTGKEMIRQIVAFSSLAAVRHRFVFLDDYDIAVARQLLQGADVWLNNPRRPQEACGTSGEKAALNGALNCSILDGWWDEMYDGENGWAIASAEGVADLAKRDQLEADSLFALLEDHIVPTFYDRTQGPVPTRWVSRIKHSLASLGPQVTATRMVKDYVEQLYEPTAARADRLAADGLSAARALAEWKERVSASWKAVHIDTVHTDTVLGGLGDDEAGADLGEERRVAAVVSLGDLSPHDVEVQLLHGPVGPNAELTATAHVPMSVEGSADDGHIRYVGSFVCERAGRYGLAVRVVPSHPDLVTPLELGKVSWA
ncbi:MAG: alpha-glucan family phosphorylase [Acidobacteria bacterium]|nr:alpha-glucan family phosphorylase [Acidobacteriota bacterium]